MFERKPLRAGLSLGTPITRLRARARPFAPRVVSRAYATQVLFANTSSQFVDLGKAFYWLAKATTTIIAPDHMILNFAKLCLLMLCYCRAFAAAAPGAIDYAEVRNRVAQALPAKADEMSDIISVLQKLSQSSSEMLARLQLECQAPPASA